jgi:hypothetical protein
VKQLDSKFVQNSHTKIMPTNQTLNTGSSNFLDEPIKQSSFKDGVSSTFSDNLSLPVHRWFKYSAGFSALWARELILREKANGRKTIFEPFAGSGTVLLEGESCGMEAVGIEAHPFVVRVAKAKLHWQTDPQAFLEYAQSLLAQAKIEGGNASNYAPLIAKCFPSETIIRLDSLRRTWKETADSSALSELAWLALASILRGCSPVGTAQWQYILPGKSKAKVLDPLEAFENKVSLMANDMSLCQARSPCLPAIVYWEDARQCTSVSDAWADLVITSPPYANNYDYADATRLEMSFFGDIQGWGDLQESVRKYLVRSCTQHVAKQNTEAILESLELEPIRTEIKKVCQLLAVERLEHGGKKAYHSMIAAYFQDMAKTWSALRRVTKDGALVCFVIGDSAPYGIHAPVDQWMGELAIAAGFKSYRFEKTRDRNTKWKNRKHRIPLHEGRLWVEG